MGASLPLVGDNDTTDGDTCRLLAQRMFQLMKRFRGLRELVAQFMDRLGEHDSKVLGLGLVLQSDMAPMIPGGTKMFLGRPRIPRI